MRWYRRPRCWQWLDAELVRPSTYTADPEQRIGVVRGLRGGVFKSPIFDYHVQLSSDPIYLQNVLVYQGLWSKPRTPSRLMPPQPAKYCLVLTIDI
mmetsp:Transcript_44457/g.172626  ORF Transcript_44457/g.172626 Transcript_44457/m.172626 type:complete len:96 (+) Transcript_44457:494-781(+)